MKDKYSAFVNGTSLHVDVLRSEDGAVEAEVAGTRYVLGAQIVEAGVFWFEWNNRSVEVSVTPNGDSYSVSLLGHRIEVEIIDARTARRKATRHGRAGAAELRAPMPGKVVKVLVEEGAAVELNQGLMVIEAMKMQNEVKSPKAGIVKKIGVRESAAVNSGDLLAVVE